MKRDNDMFEEIVSAVEFLGYFLRIRTRALSSRCN